MRGVLLPVLVVASLYPQASPLNLPDAAVQQAITEGLSGRRTDAPGCRAGGGFGQLKGFTVEATGPLNRIAAVARQAKAQYKPFAIEDVAPEMRAGTLVVVATPQVPEYNNVGRFWDQAAPATHLVLKPHGAKGEAVTAVQPLEHTLVPAEWSNMAGGTLKGQGISASFDLAVFRAIPTKDVDVTVVTSDGEKTCTLSAKARAAIQ